MLVLNLVVPSMSELFNAVQVGNDHDALHLLDEQQYQQCYKTVEDLINRMAKDELDFEELSDTFFYAGTIFELLTNLVNYIQLYVDIKYFGLIRVKSINGAIFIYP